jgi:hypothetical protein
MIVSVILSGWIIKVWIPFYLARVSADGNAGRVLVTFCIICIDLEDRTVELSPGRLITIPANVKHCTRPKHSRFVNITFEREDIKRLDRIGSCF